MISILSRIDRICKLYPSAIAVTFFDHRLNYAQLNAASDQVAQHLRESGIGFGDTVGVCLERSLELAVSLLGVLKTGACVVPLDSNYPKHRLAYMLAQAKIEKLIASEETSKMLPLTNQSLFKKAQIETIIQNLKNSPKHDSFSLPLLTANDLLYVLYTSGSTGLPKGVAMGHGAIANLIEWQLGDSEATTGTKTLQFSPISFDVSFQEFFSTWCSGGELVLIDDETRLNAVKLLKLIRDEKIQRIFLPFIALQTLSEIAANSIGKDEVIPFALKEIITAGEQLQITKQMIEVFSKIKNLTLFNHYGPTETHVVTSFKLVGDARLWPKLPPIGKPVLNTEILIVDDQLKTVAPGNEGELLVAGSNLAQGYLHQPELTNERFITLDGKRYYRTGDLARATESGNFEYLGRIDGQVKVRGYRIELAEIELALSEHSDIQQAVVGVQTDEATNEKYLCCFYQTVCSDEIPSSDLRTHLKKTLPDYMVPTYFKKVETFPRTPSGKIDRRNLPKVVFQKITSVVSEIKIKSSDLEKMFLQTYREALRNNEIQREDNFFDLGGNSLKALQLVAKLKQTYDYDLSITSVFQYPSIAELMKHLSHAPSALNVKNKINSNAENRDIAIIGMAGRFPGAKTIEALWENLCTGKEGIQFFKDSELDPSVPYTDSNYVKARGVLKESDLFDASFFGIPPKEAELMDPQQRVFLEVAVEALEDASIAYDKSELKIGVFAGMHNNSYFPNNVSTRPDLIENVGSFSVMTGNEKDYLATRVSHKLNLKGPSLSIHTGCSTSLVAIATAVQNLRHGECDVAIAGGIAITAPQNSGHHYLEGGMLSQDGHCKPFDENASGTIFSDGTGIVVLKRLQDALTEKDTIHAVIKGIALNNDGSQKASFTAPSIDGQAEVIFTAQLDAGITADQISYIEAHGTATPLGDPIEFEGLTKAFRQTTALNGFSRIGSIKGNLGHLTAAAGVAGLIKTVKILEEKKIPPTLHFKKSNPKIDFAQSPFILNQTLEILEKEQKPLYAGVSSFGVGGTNAHAVLSEAPEAKKTAAETLRPLPLFLSAKTESALAQATENLLKPLSEEGKTLSDISYTLAAGRASHAQRKVIVAKSKTDAIDVIQTKNLNRQFQRKYLSKNSEIVFLFPGQGSQYVAMGKDLYDNYLEFKSAFDECVENLKHLIGYDLKEILFNGNKEQTALTLQDTFYTQPALFSIEYATAQLFKSFDVVPDLLIGHSVGEFVAATLAGVFTLQDALLLVSERAKLMKSMPNGKMLSVRLPAPELQKRLNSNCSIASVNSSKLCVASGPSEEIDLLALALENEGVVCKGLHTSHAFHSPMMEPAIAPFHQIVTQVKLNAPEIEIISTVTGKTLTNQEATDPHYWSSHLRKTVNFSAAVSEAWDTDSSRILIEIGPRSTLSTLAKQHATDLKNQIALASLGDSSEDQLEQITFLKALGALWCLGSSVDISKIFETTEKRKVKLPTYPFERKRFWIEPKVENSLNSVLKGKEPMSNENRKQKLVAEIATLLEDVSGIEINPSETELSFIEMGMDSLFLTQAATSLQKKFSVKVTFRQLIEEICSLNKLAEFILPQLPKEVENAPVTDCPPTAVAISQPMQETPKQAISLPGTQTATMPMTLPILSTSATGMESLISQQLQLMQMQLGLLSGQSLSSVQPTLHVMKSAQPETALPAAAMTTTPAANLPAQEKTEKLIKAEVDNSKKAFGASARISLSKDTLSEKQKAKLEEITSKYVLKTKTSKEMTQENRKHLADPRVVSGFKPNTKEIVYPIVVKGSKGSKLFDVDGNEYIDMTCGFGSNFFGNGADFIIEAVKKQLDIGYEIGPQHPLAGEVTEGVAKMVGMDRAALCNTGSEAVLGAMRLARTVTGRSLIVTFNGAYHGIIDEVIVRPGKNFKSMPAAPGIPTSAVENLLVLEYGTDESLKIIKERGNEIAAVLCETVQSRRPDLQPKAFLEEIRKITKETGSAFIFDEVITGFRIHPGGAQAHFGIKADLATYGKVIGGGMPIGVIAGSAEFMDALDGGYWEFGNTSIPTVGVTYFAGTFVRHPLTLAAAKAVLDKINAEGMNLYSALNANADYLVSSLNALFYELGVPMKLKQFGSLMKLNYTEDQSYGELLYTLLRHKGVHIWDQRPCFLTTSHTRADLDFVINAFREALVEMQEGEFLPQSNTAAEKTVAVIPGLTTQPPVAGAKLGRDINGNPAWFISDTKNPGKYIQVGTSA